MTNLRGNPFRLFKRRLSGYERKLALQNITDAYNRIEKGDGRIEKGDGKYSKGFLQIDKDNLLMHYTKAAARR